MIRVVGSSRSRHDVRASNPIDLHGVAEDTQNLRQIESSSFPEGRRTAAGRGRQHWHCAASRRRAHRDSPGTAQATLPRWQCSLMSHVPPARERSSREPTCARGRDRNRKMNPDVVPETGRRARWRRRRRAAGGHGHGAHRSRARSDLQCEIPQPRLTITPQPFAAENRRLCGEFVAPRLPDDNPEKLCREPGW